MPVVKDIPASRGLHDDDDAMMFGFHSAEMLTRRLNVGRCSCHWTYALDPLRRVIVRTHGAAATEIPYTDTPTVDALRAAGFQLSPAPLLRRGGVTILAMSKKCSWLPSAQHHLVVVDDTTDVILQCHAIENSDVTNRVSDVEILGVAYNADKSVLVMSIGLMNDSTYVRASYENIVVVYDTKAKRQLNLFLNRSDHVVYDVTIDPRPLHAHMLTVRVPNDTHHAAPSIRVHDYMTAALCREVSLASLLDADQDGTGTVRLSCSPDGLSIVLQVLDSVGYTADTLYTTYVLNTDSLTVLMRIASAEYPPCPRGCLTVDTTPVWSRCNTTLTLSDTDETTGQCRVRFHRLPTQLQLKHQCRVTILKHIHNKQRVAELPLPVGVKSYLMWMQWDHGHI